MAARISPDINAKYLSVRDFAARYGLSISTIYVMLKHADTARRLPSIKLGGRRLIPVAAADQVFARAEAA